MASARIYRLSLWRLLLWALLALGGGGGNTLAQQELSVNAAAEKQFADAVLLFKNGKFAEAAAVFDGLYRQKPPHQRTTAAYLMLAKSWFELKRYQPSALLLLEFLERFPASSYVDDAWYTLGLDHMMEGDIPGAGSDLLRCIERSGDRSLAERAESLFEYLADERFTTQGLERLLHESLQESAADLVRLKLAGKYRAAGDLPRTKQALYEVVGSENGIAYRARARAMLDTLERESPVRIGVVLPLMEDVAANPVKRLAGELLEGITFAMKGQALHPRSRTPVSIEVRDSKRDSSGAVNAVRDLVSSPDIVGVVGPVFSGAVSACASTAHSSGTPLVTPTATANGLAYPGSHVFQLHPDWSVRGKAMARYAVNYLGFSTLAILSSGNAPESLAARSFAEEARRLGASVIAEETFPVGASDLREQFLRIRKAATAGVPDSLRPAVDTVSGNTDIMVTSIQGIFVAVDNSEEIGVIGSQLSYFNVKTQILGDEEWYDPVQLDIHKQYVNGSVFASDYYTDPHDSAFAQFDQAFYSATARHPTRYTVIGYDTIVLLLDQLAGGATTRANLTDALRHLEKYQALHTTVTLTHGGANSEVHILKYVDGEVKPIIDISVN